MKLISYALLLTFIATSFLACSGDEWAYHSGRPHITSQGSSSGFVPPDLSDTYAYTLSGTYSSELKNCSIAETEEEVCTLETLPLIGHEFPNPTIDDVMTRVVVSHDWMGSRFRETLAVLPADILTLLKGVTAIVIDNNIRPSYYFSGTGAIYLDPENLWLDNAEKATIAKTEDFRSDYGYALSFMNFWRYIKNNDDAYAYYSLDGTETRQLQDIIYPFAALLFHELGHANDFIPPSQINNIDMQQPVYIAADAVYDQSPSYLLKTNYPLASQMWFSLASVLYQGTQATLAQQNLTASEVGIELEGDAANESYSYSHEAEDVAMLFEESMMKYHFDVDRDIAMLPVPSLPESCDDYVVEWGYRNRVGAALVLPRAEYVTGLLLPSRDYSGFFAAFPPPAQMAYGYSWCQNLDLGASLPYLPGPLSAAPQDFSIRIKANSTPPR